MKALTLDLKAVIHPIRALARKIYIWDFDGNEDNLKNELGSKTKVISHPTLQYLKGLHIKKIFLVGFHAMAGLHKEFCPHTYSGVEIKRFTINGKPIGEATLFTHLFSQFNIPIVFICGSYYACRELTLLKIDAEKVAIRKNKVVYNVVNVRNAMAAKAIKAIKNTGHIIKYKNYHLTITFHKPIARFFRNTRFTIKSPYYIVGSSAHFELLYQDFVNGIFKYWGDPFRL